MSRSFFNSDTLIVNFALALDVFRLNTIVVHAEYAAKNILVARPKLKVVVDFFWALTVCKFPIRFMKNCKLFVVLEMFQKCSKVQYFYRTLSICKKYFLHTHHKRKFLTFDSLLQIILSKRQKIFKAHLVCAKKNFPHTHHAFLKKW